VSITQYTRVYNKKNHHTGIFITEIVQCGGSVFWVSGEPYSRTIGKLADGKATTFAEKLKGASDLGCVDEQYLLFHHVVGYRAVIESTKVGDGKFVPRDPPKEGEEVASPSFAPTSPPSSSVVSYTDEDGQTHTSIVVVPGTTSNVIGVSRTEDPASNDGASFALSLSLLTLLSFFTILF
jgi:hypothetical protein